MILVTVGMHTEGFSRLVVEMDRLATQVDEQVIIQIGHTAYRPRAARWFSFAPYEEMQALCERARVIVSHAGAGSILTALRYQKPLIVVPRRKKYGEILDDHQLELAEVLSETSTLLLVYETEELADKLQAAEHFTPRLSARGHLIEALHRAVLAGSRRTV